MSLDMQKPLSDDEYRLRKSRPRGAFGAIWDCNGAESAHSLTRCKVASVAVARERKWRFSVDNHLREMAKILLVDRLVSEYESGNELFKFLAKAAGCGCELMESVPNAFVAKKISLDEAIDHLVPEMHRLIVETNARLGGILTVENLGKVNERVFTSLALNAAGHGVCITDDRDIDDLFVEKNIAVPHVYVNDSKISEAVYIVEELLHKRQNRFKGRQA
jgi:hypothetical protein